MISNRIRMGIGLSENEDKGIYSELCRSHMLEEGTTI
jgi:hypothetical protein